jgi:hypothetical protein
VSSVLTLDGPVESVVGLVLGAEGGDELTAGGCNLDVTTTSVGVVADTVRTAERRVAARERDRKHCVAAPSDDSVATRIHRGGESLDVVGPGQSRRSAAAVAGDEPRDEIRPGPPTSW